MNVGVVSPKALIRNSLCALLARISGVSRVLDLDGSLAAVEELKRLGPNILLVDSVDATTDFDVLSRTRALLPEMRVLLLADEPDEDYQVQAIRLGARGFVSRSCSPEVSSGL